MANKCQNCGELLKDKDLSCSKCGLVLVNPLLTSDQETRIAAETAATLSKQRGFLWGVGWRTFVMIMAVLGFALGWGVWSAVEFTKNLVLQQFKEERIHNVVVDVASNQAGSLMITQIEPEVLRFRKDVSATIVPIQRKGEALDAQIHGMSAEFSAFTAQNRESELKVSALNTALSNANAQLTELKMNAEISIDQLHQQLQLQTLILEAMADVLPAFDKLIAYPTISPEQRFVAVQTVNSIATSLNTRVALDDSYTASINDNAYDPDALSLDEFKRKFNELDETKTIPTDRVWLVRLFVKRQNKFPKAERLQFLADILDKERSILVTATVCHLLESDAHLRKNVVAHQEYSAWLIRQIAIATNQPASVNSK